MKSVYDKDGNLIAASVSRAAQILGWSPKTIRRHITWDSVISGYCITSQPYNTGSRGGPRPGPRPRRNFHKCAFDGCNEMLNWAVYCNNHRKSLNRKTVKEKKPHPHMVRVYDENGDLFALSIRMAARMLNCANPTIFYHSEKVDDQSRKLISRPEDGRRRGPEKGSRNKKSDKP